MTKWTIQDLKNKGISNLKNSETKSAKVSLPDTNKKPKKKSSNEIGTGKIISEKEGASSHIQFNPDATKESEAEKIASQLFKCLLNQREYVGVVIGSNEMSFCHRGFKIEIKVYSKPIK